MNIGRAEVTKLLVTGRGKSGSWQVRGEQLGRAIGATVQANALDVAAFDMAIVVKRPQAGVVDRIHRAGIPLVWDVVDSFPQPESNSWGREECMAWLRGKVNEIAPEAIVAATRAMALDCVEFGIPVLALPHHARPGLERNPIRLEIKTVGYEGSSNHLGRWAAVLKEQCDRRGWRFVVNPASLAELDVVVAMRESDGYAARNWKSNVKLANAQGSGTPCIVNGESGYVETSVGGECWVHSETELPVSMDALVDHSARLAASAELLKGTISLEGVAKEYARWLRKI